ncbi:cell division protein FtsQ/DivIB [Streptomyces bohaiensis]|uniref:FtsQ-type POTRA domain-containing protein n=1 Tax=Streptomyces bohaiensis TaxID=1431344 RepID=A0ABX1CAW6_9ACTN|nr:FtsQ-type POTRA domain-containing protein [Streptomyces bohaiensis]NJQ16266.1 FtsQ-type POTRA domain-containing protein [Streptomyces bohaiensis]
MAGPVRTAERDEERGPLDTGSGAPGAGGPPPRRRRLPGRGLLVGLLVLGVASGGFGVWALYGSQWLRVEQVSVDWTGGPRQLERAEVLEAAAVPLGAPMAALDKGAVRQRVLETLPRAGDVQVVRAWPNGVGLKVTEREAEVLVPDPEGYIEVDPEGVAFALVPDAVEGVPLLEMELDSGAGLRRFGEDRIRLGAVGVVSALPEAVREQTEVVRVRSWDAVLLELADGRTVLWGSPEEPEAKATSLTAVMKAVPEARHFDVTVPSSPAAESG